MKKFIINSRYFVVMIIICAMMLSGCTEENANITIKQDSQNITVYSDQNCNKALKIELSIQIPVNLEKEEYLTIPIQDILKNENLNLDNVTVVQDTSSILLFWVIISCIVLGILIVLAFYSIKHFQKEYEDL